MLLVLVKKTTFKMAAESMIQFSVHVGYLDIYLLRVEGKGPECLD